jgi:carbonic anhydrase/acetyltransferase-like protein (isoleucine patch superfamily)
MFRKIKFHVGFAFRETAQALDKVGLTMQGNFAFKEPLNRHRRIMSFMANNGVPQIGQGSWIAPNATIIGKVSLGFNSTIWYGAIVRGDTNSIKIGNHTSIGDRAVIRVAPVPYMTINDAKSYETNIGNNVVIEPGSLLHCVTLEDGVKIEAGAILFDGVVVGQNAIVGSGSVVPAETKIPAGEYWAGSPARFVRKVTDSELSKKTQEAEKYHELATEHDKEHSRTQMQREEDMINEMIHQDKKRTPGEIYKQSQSVA